MVYFFLSKLTKHIFLTHLQNFLLDTPEQFGFRPIHSTAHQLLRVVEYIYDGIDNCEYVSSVFMDVANAFDTFWLASLIYKLLKRKVSTAHVQFVFKYLHGRTLCESLTMPIYFLHLAGLMWACHSVRSWAPGFTKLISTSPHTLMAIYVDYFTAMGRDKNWLIMHGHLQQHIREFITTHIHYNTRSLQQHIRDSISRYGIFFHQMAYQN